ncbi:DUF5776 domain-containing protein [Kurthia massiliensis]|uniref:DUF5776 domain-containing protein n=1 Tax=Kurthia massiliensis TaxID=1033739 RepID=UPI000288B537|nr:DUF5776 domain-containing protein [Kurthia massiliensis]
MKNILKKASAAALLTSAFVMPTMANAETLSPAKPDSTVEWEGTPYVTDTTKLRTMSTDETIIDVSKWQGNIDWSKVAKTVDFAIIRTQYGSSVEDYMHRTYEAQAKANGVPFGVYSYSLAISSSDARQEARDFYNRADKSAQMYVIDVEELTGKSGESMRTIINAYVDELRKYTDKKVGLYIAHHLYNTLNLDTSKADFVWIPRYGSSAPSYKYDLWQYTDRGIVSGISGYVDMNRLNPSNDLNDIRGKSTLVTQASNNDVDTSKYFTSNPKYVLLKKSAGVYKTTSFTDDVKIRTLDKGTVVEVQGIAYTASGVPRLKIGTNKYISANKSYMDKITASYENFYYNNPEKVILNKNVSVYDSVDFNDDTKVATMLKGDTVEITGIELTDGGTPRLELSNGHFISANRSYVQKVRADIENYVTDVPERVLTLQDLTLYNDLACKKVYKDYGIDRTFVIDHIEYTEAGTPRLVTNTGKYMTSLKSHVLPVPLDVKNYYYTSDVPEKVTTVKSISSFSDVDLTKKVETLPVGTTLSIADIEFSQNGVPRFKTADGLYVSAYKTKFE